MTVGTHVSDGRHYVETYTGSYSLAGERFQRVWSGGDRSDPQDVMPHNYTLDVSHSFNGEIDYHPLWDPTVSLHSTVFDLFGAGASLNLNWSDNDTLKLAVKLGNKIRTIDFNAAIFLAEADQSLTLIGDSATRIAKAFSAIKSGKLDKAAGYLANGHLFEKIVFDLKKHFKHKSAFDDRKVLADAILEIQYGWRPLLSDAAAAGEALASILSRPPKSTYKATRQIQGTRTNEYELSRHKWRTRKVISQRLTATVSAPPSWREQLRLNNYAQAITNRTPWAFVLNWFIPFEDYLEARNTFTDLHISRLLLTTKVHTSSVFSSVDNAEAWVKNFSFSREVQPIADLGPSSFANSFLPLPSVKPIEKSLGWEHVLNGIALLNGVEKRYRD